MGCDPYAWIVSDSFSISTHTSRVGCDYAYGDEVTTWNHFYSHIPCGMWPKSFNSIIVFTQHFYSHIPCGMWLLCEVEASSQKDFYSHIPCGMWLLKSSSFSSTPTFLLTHPVWDVTQILLFLTSLPVDFYSHIPCGMWRFHPTSWTGIMKFLLTHPVWDVTFHPVHKTKENNISTHTSRVGCD